MITLNWQPIPGTPDYRDAENQLIAVYRDSFGGYANYWVFKESVKSRKLKNALCCGGLPEKLTINK